MYDEFFVGRKIRIEVPAKSGHPRHPDDQMLIDYVSGAIPADDWTVPAAPADSAGWTLTRLSLHLLTCESCERRVAGERAQRLAARRLPRPTAVLRPRWLVYTAVGVLLLVIGLSIFRRENPVVPSYGRPDHYLERVEQAV